MKHPSAHTLLFYLFAIFTTQTITILGSNTQKCITNTCDIEEYLEHAENILTREHIYKKPFHNNFLAHFTNNYAVTENDQERAVQARILDKIMICQKVASGVIGESRRKVGGWFKRDIESQCVEETCDFNEYVEVMENDFGEGIKYDWDLKSTFEKDYVEVVRLKEVELGKGLNKNVVRKQGIDEVQDYLMSTMTYYGDLCKKNDKNCNCVKTVVDSEPKTVSKAELEPLIDSEPVLLGASFLTNSKTTPEKTDPKTTLNTMEPLPQDLSVKTAKKYIQTYFRKHVDFGSGELRTTEDFLVGSETRLETVRTDNKGSSSFPYLQDEEKIMAFRRFYKLSYDYVELARFIERKFSKLSSSGNRLNLKTYKTGTANRKFCHGQRKGRVCTIYYEFQGESLNDSLNNSSVIQQALCLWSKATNINFVESFSKKEEKITFIQNTEKWNSKFLKKEFGMKHASGFSYPPKRPYHNKQELSIENGDFYGNVFFNPDFELEPQTDDTKNGKKIQDLNILYEVLHRIGHAIGLGFSNDPKSVMYVYESVPLKTFFEKPVFELPVADQKVIRNLYGGKRQEFFMWNNYCSDYF